MTKITPELEWLRPFLDAARNMCNTSRIDAIKGYAAPFDKSERQDAQILVDTATKKATILIRVMNHHYVGGRVVGRRPAYKAEVLDHLAHELAHLTHWEHTHEHYLLQARILAKFAKVIQQQDIKDTWARMDLPRTQKWLRRAS